MEGDSHVVCDAAVGARQEGLQYDLCSKWQHRKCNSGVTRELYRILVIGVAELEQWKCRNCTELQDPKISFNPIVESTSVSAVSLEDNVIPAVPPADDDVVPAVPPADDDVVPAVPPADDDVVPAVPPADDDVIPAVPPADDDVVPAVPPADDDVVPDVPPADDDNVMQDVSYQIPERGNHYTAGPHLHEADTWSHAKARISVVVKKSVREHVFASAGILVQEALMENSKMKFLPKQSNLDRVTNQHRQKMRPNHPSDLDFETQYDHVPEDFLKRDIIVNEKRHLLCATDHRFDLLKKAKQWYVDATFKMVKAPFTELLSVHSQSSLHSKPLHGLELISFSTITSVAMATLFSVSWTHEYFYGFFAFHTPGQTGAD